MARKKKSSPSTAATDAAPSSSEPVTKAESTRVEEVEEEDTAPEVDEVEEVEDTSPASPLSTSAEAADGDDSQRGPPKSKYNIPEGLTKSQKRNLIHKLRAKEKKAQELASKIENVMPEDPYDADRQECMEKLQQALKSVPNLNKMKPDEVVGHYNTTNTTLDTIEQGIDEGLRLHNSKVKRSELVRQKKPQDILNEIRQLERQPEKDEHTYHWLNHQLTLAVSFDNLKKFQTAMNDLRSRVRDRRAANKKAYETALQEQRTREIVERIKVLKSINNAPIDAITAANITTYVGDSSPEIMSFLFVPPLRMSQRLERHFGVIIDRPDRTRKHFTLAGLESDVTRCNHFLKNADFSGRNRVTLDSRSISALIGTGGSGIRSVERQFNCFLHTERQSSEVLIIGCPDDVANCVAHVKQLKAEQEELQHEGDLPLAHSAISRALVTTFRPQITAIEQEHGVMIRVQHGHGRDSGDATGRPMAIFRGKNECTEKAKKAVQQMLANVDFEVIDTTSQAMRKLFSTGGVGGAGGMGPQGPNETTYIREQFAIIRDSTRLAFSRDEDPDTNYGKLIMVGDKKELAEAKPKIEELLEKAAYTVNRKLVLREQRRCFDPENTALIETESGATVRVGRLVQDKLTINVLGSDEQKEKAEKLIDELLEREGVLEVITVEQDDTISRLLRDRGQRINEMQDATGAQISIDRQTKSVKIFGARRAVDSAKKQLQQMDADIKAHNDSLITKVIPVEAGRVAAIIGRRGLTINNIRNQSKVDRLIVEDDQGVKLVGTEKAIEIAQRMIEEILSDTRSTPRVDTERDSPVAEQQPRVTRGPGGKAGKNAAPAKKLEVEDETAFPTLGAAASHRVPKRPNRRRRGGAAAAATGSPSQGSSDKDEAPVTDGAVSSALGTSSTAVSTTEVSQPEAAPSSETTPPPGMKPVDDPTGGFITTDDHEAVAEETEAAWGADHGEW